MTCGTSDASTSSPAYSIAAVSPNTCRRLPHGRLVALVFADVNGLKHTNDTQGHEAGDRLIKQTADALRQEPDAVVFRMGGDEFLLIRDVQTPEEIETIRQSLKQEFHRRGISAALGAITLPTPIEDIDAAIAEVDRLMYEDKTRHYRAEPHGQRQSVKHKKGLTGDESISRETFLAC